MMRRRLASTPKPESSIIDGALAAMGAEELRELVRDIISWIDEKTHARLVNELVDRAVRNETGWSPAGPTNEGVSEVVTFAEAAERSGYADPSEVDDYLRLASNAFLGKNYHAALQIFRALLIPISNGDIDLGQHEMIDEVLGVDVAECAAQYVVAVYMTSVPVHRAKAVRGAIDDVDGTGQFWEPLCEIERVAVEPLPGLDDFLPRWRALVEQSVRGERRSDWDTNEDRRLREVVQRMEGADGLAKIARSTKRSDDLRAWCRVLVTARDWKAALSAFEEAAEIVTEKIYSRGSFLDGAALATQALGRRDLPNRLERAWQATPSLLRLRRWLGSSGSQAVLRKRAAAAFETCPPRAHRQKALLYVLLEHLEPAAELLASAPGLGWSDGEHPGHLLFPLFWRLLGAKSPAFGQDTGTLLDRGMDTAELEPLSSSRDEPRLANPSVDGIIEVAGIGAVTSATGRAAVIAAMCRAAEKRIAGVTENKRRRHYGHAALLASACVAVGPPPEMTSWMASIRSDYRRYPALQREFQRHEG